MKIYFLSSLPCALTLNGVYFGITDSFERSAEVCLSDKIYAEFSPEGGLPIGFFITENLRDTPPEGCEVYLLQDGLAVYARDFQKKDFTLRPIAQAREGNLLATVFWQGALQLTIESPKGFFNATLPPSFDPCTLSFHGDFLLIEGNCMLALYSLACKRLLLEKISDFSLDDNTLNATLPLSDRLGRSAKCVWELTQENCVLKEFTLLQAGACDEPPADLLAYAFFESFLIGGDFTLFLADELIADAENIRAFLGDFIAVTLTDKANVCGLVRRKKERLFEVDYFSVEIEKGKIVDVKG